MDFVRIRARFFAWQHLANLSKPGTSVIIALAYDFDDTDIHNA